MERVYNKPHNKIIKDYKEYDDRITIRVSKKYYRLINKFNRYNNAFFIRQLIKCDLKENFYYIFDIKDYEKVIKTFTSEEINNLKDFRYYEKKEHKITVRLFKEDKEEIRQRSNNNITNYIELLLNDFINNILDTVEPI